MTYTKNWTWLWIFVCVIWLSVLSSSGWCPYCFVKPSFFQLNFHTKTITHLCFQTLVHYLYGMFQHLIILFFMLQIFGLCFQVFDCWFESGSMPYAYIHYPFENVKLFENNFPGPFVAEGLDQTRGWFVSFISFSPS